MQQPQHIVVVGGGTAGWMAASLLNHAWGGSSSSRVTLIESSDIDTIGVGEGSTPYMRQFFRNLGIAESEWMPACNATYKCGIRFPDWSTKPGFESYFHPFFSRLDLEPAADFFLQCNLRRRGENASAHPDDFFVAAELSRQKLSPIPKQQFDFEHDYAYHFDAGLLATFLKRRAKDVGVDHVIDNVLSVERAENGNISGLRTEKHGSIEGDLFFDCTGFASLLIGKTLAEPFQSYSGALFNDCAVAMPTAIATDQPLPSETVSTAASSGWMWRIPLTARYGNGYVYSSQYLSADEAEIELRQRLGAEAEGVEARHLKMRIGRVEQHWSHNCVAAGLSQGFIEPLEATAIGLIQLTIDRFIECFEKGDFTDRYRDSFNEEVSRAFDGTKDYVSLHYRLNSRDDSQYWIDNREQGNVSLSLQHLIDAWDGTDSFDEALQQEKLAQAYLRPSWYCLFSGMGRYPTVENKSAAYQAAASRARRLCQRLSKQFQPHQAQWLMQR